MHSPQGEHALAAFLDSCRGHPRPCPPSACRFMLAVFHCTARLVSPICPLLAPLRHADEHRGCPLIGVERKGPADGQVDAIDPDRTSVSDSKPSGRRAQQVIGTHAARLKLIAEQFPTVPATISLHRVGLIRRGCSLRANCLELGLLLVAQRSIETVKC